VITLLGSGGSVDDNVLTGLDGHDDWLVEVSQILSGISIFVPIGFMLGPMLIQPVSILLDSTVKTQCSPRGQKVCGSLMLNILLTFVIFFACFITVVLLPGDLDLYVNLIGSSTLSLVMFIYPALVHLATLREESRISLEQEIEYSYKYFNLSIFLHGWKDVWSYCDKLSAICSLLTIVFGLIILVFGTVSSIQEF
jgi:hypothetical protein